MTMQQMPSGPNSVKRTAATATHEQNSNNKILSPDTVATAETMRSETKSPGSLKPLVSPYKKDTRKIFVGGLGNEVNNESFREFFEKFGEIVDSIVMVDRDTKRPRGFGFVTFQDSEVAKRVLSQGNEGKPEPKAGFTCGSINIFGKFCEVKVCEPKKTKSPPMVMDEIANTYHNEPHFSTSKSICSSENSTTMVPSNIQFHSGYHNMQDAQYGIGNDHHNMMYPQYYYPVQAGQGIYPQPTGNLPVNSFAQSPQYGSSIVYTQPMYPVQYGNQMTPAYVDEQVMQYGLPYDNSIYLNPQLSPDVSAHYGNPYPNQYHQYAPINTQVNISQSHETQEYQSPVDQDNKE